MATITDQQESIGHRSMAYDRLTAANAPGVWGSGTYGYDPLDNLRTSVVGSRNSTHLYDASNRLTTISTNGVPTGYAYDSQGNITARGSRGYYFDQGNRMTLANGVASYTYDGLGRRTSISDGNGYRVQVYGQAGQLLYGMQQQGMVVKNTRYVHLAGKQIAETNSATGTTFVHTDALGSPVARTNAVGDLALINRTRYEAYGNTAAGTIPNGIGFIGHVNDPDTGLVYMQQRYYDPIAGRFQSVDPVITDANSGSGFNLYEYAQNNPYRYTDPDGRQIEERFPESLRSSGRCPSSKACIGDDAKSSVPEEMERTPGQIGSAKANALGNDIASGLSTVAETTFELTAGGGLGVGFKAGTLGARTAKGVGEAIKKAPVVIGESMKERVIPAAKEIGGHFYRPRGEWTAAKQERCAKEAKRQVDRGGRDLVDIGRDPERAVPSKAYEIERRIFDK